MLVAFIFYIFSASAWALDDEVRQLVGAPQLRSPNIGQVPVQFYKRDDMGTEKVLTIKPLNVEKNFRDHKPHLLSSIHNTDNVNVMLNSISHGRNSLNDNETKLQHLLAVVRDCLERHRATHANEEKTKATVSVQYDIPTTHCPHTLNALDLLKHAYQEVDQASKITHDPVVLSNIDQISSYASGNCHDSILNYQQVPKYFENLSNLRLSKHNEERNVYGEASEDIRNLRDNDQKSVINQFMNSENAYTIGDSKNKNQEKSQALLSLLLNRPSINVPTMPSVQEDTQNDNVFALLNVISELKKQPRDYTNQYYLKILTEKLNNILNKAKINNNNDNLLTYLQGRFIKNHGSHTGLGPQNSAVYYNQNPYLNSISRPVKYRPFPDYVEINQNTKDGIDFNSPTPVDNIANSIQENYLNIEDNLKVLGKPIIQSNTQHLRNRYGLYHTLGINQVNPDPVTISRDRDVTPVNIPVGVNNLREPTDLSQLLGMTNQLKLNNVPNNKGVVELTYVIRHAKPAYQPLYYVKYRLPSHQFYNNLRNVLTQNIHLRSGPQDLNEELLAGSNVTEVAGDLRDLNSEEITKLISNNGTLVTARVLRNNEATADDQLKIIQDINSKLFLVNSDNSNVSDRQRLQAIEKLVNATKSNILDKNLRTYYDPSMVDFQKVSRGYNVISPSNTLLYTKPQVQTSNYYKNNLYQTYPKYPNVYG